MSSALTEYIIKAREHNLSEKEIKTTLLTNGWPQEQVETAFSTNPSATSLVPPPPPIPQVGMWVGFVYTIFFISLYVLATSISLIFHLLIEHLVPALPSITTSSDYPYLSYTTSFLFFDTFYRGVLTIAIASIIVSYPLFTLLAILLKKQLRTHPAVKNLRSRKILIYATLIVTFFIMISHLILTIYHFLMGFGTWNTIGHLIVTLVIEGLIFWYFLSEVKHDNKN